jgi:glycosyltransferase involved in cell wall biosynthesis
MADKLQIIVVDSASQQNERNIVQEFQREHQNITYIRTEQRETLYAAWNRAIEASRSRYITYANTDDRHRVDFLEKMVGVLENERNFAVVYAHSAVTREGNETYPSADVIGHFIWPKFDPRLLFQVCYIGPQPVWRRALHDKYGLFDPEFKCAGDYDFWLRLVSSEKFCLIPEVLGLYLLSPTGLEHGNEATSRRESEIARRRNWPAVWGQRPKPESSFFVPCHSRLVYKISEIAEPIFRKRRSSGSGPSSQDNSHAHTGEGHPLISVILPTRNRPELFRQALNSIMNQTYQNFEVIVADAGTFEVGDIVTSFNRSGNILYVRCDPDQNPASTRNGAIKAAKGLYIAYLDDDDVFYRDHLETLVTFLRNSDYKAAYTDTTRAFYIKGDETYVLAKKSRRHSWDFDADLILTRNLFPLVCVMHEKACLDEVGLFDETLATHEDWELWIRMSRKVKFGHVRKVTCEYSQRTGNNSITNYNRADFLETMKTIFERYGDYVCGKPHILKAQKVSVAVLEAELRHARKLHRIRELEAAIYAKLVLLKSPQERT